MSSHSDTVSIAIQTDSTMDERMGERIVKIEQKLLQIEASIYSTVLKILKDYWSIFQNVAKESGLSK